ncbi:hypothetical protein DL768_004915 [Monosporascus sp. mg162]|nr:hypothetical protein DL768_004915 [Monosporascus sp. mg162]
MLPTPSTANLPEYWQDFGTISTGKGFGDYPSGRFVDLNGYISLWPDEVGKTWPYTSNRGYSKGQEGVNGLTPLWRAAENMVDGAGLTHADMGVKGARDDVFFGQNLWRAAGIRPVGIL